MNKRMLWFSTLVCCVAAITVVLIRFKAKPSSSSQVEDVQSAQPATDAVPEAAESDLHSTPFNIAADTLQVRHEPRSPANGGTSVPEPSARESAGPLPNVALLPAHTAAVKESATTATLETEPQAEVWSYPPLLQQNASNNFVRAMEKLGNAKSEFHRYLALGDAAKSDFIFGKIEDARSCATELLALDEKFSGQPWRDGSAVFDGNLVLGRIAAREGRMDEAKRHLLESGQSTGSPGAGEFWTQYELGKRPPPRWRARRGAGVFRALSKVLDDWERKVDTLV